jgi:glycosyltransferase involved in cell wall biosynthesis
VNPAKVSIIMLTYNRPQYIDRAIESVLAQDFQDWSLLVVHDGANNRIAALMESWQRRDSRIQYLPRPKGGNIANATNYGLARAQGEYIAILDDDDYWPATNKLSRQVEFLDQNPDYAGCGGGFITIDEHGRETARYFKVLADEQIRRLALVANPMVHSTGMFRRSLIEECGYYDETLAGFQDWDVWLKLGQRGKLCNFPEYWLVYQMWAGGGSFSRQKANTRSALQIVMRHRREYPGYPAAISMASLYYLYACLPHVVKRVSFDLLSRLKKTAFASKHVT